MSARVSRKWIAMVAAASCFLSLSAHAGPGDLTGEPPSEWRQAARTQRREALSHGAKAVGFAILAGVASVMVLANPAPSSRDPYWTSRPGRLTEEAADSHWDRMGDEFGKAIHAYRQYRWLEATAVDLESNLRTGGRALDGSNVERNGRTVPSGRAPARPGAVTGAAGAGMSRQ